MKRLILMFVLGFVLFSYPVYAEESSSPRWTHELGEFENKLDHTHDFNIEDFREPFDYGVGVEGVIYEFNDTAKFLDEIRVDGSYFVESDEARVLLKLRVYLNPWQKNK